MKYTLLELTQTVLSSMDSDEVNSITDTVEAQQVVDIIKTVYDDIITRSDLGIHKTLFNLTPSGDATKPVLMTKPSTIDRIIWLKYNIVGENDTDPEWRELQYRSPEDFIQYVQGFSLSAPNIDSFSYTSETFTTVLHYMTDTAPLYYTTFNDEDIIFDAYDSSVDTTLQSNKTLCYGTRQLFFLRENSFVPELQPQQFALLLNEAKSLAWAELKQTAHLKAEQTAKRNWTRTASKRNSIPTGEFGSGAHPFDQLPHYGRK